MSVLKGKTVIELKDQNGNVETYENENMITNAVPNILKMNPFGWVRASDSFLPLQKMFGGILLFENTLTENANNIFPTEKPMGWAGYRVNTTDFIKRGSPNLTETGPISNGFKYVWDFTTAQANGIISSVGLTHGGAGCSDRDDMLLNDGRFLTLYNGGRNWSTEGTGETDLSLYNGIIAVDGDYCYSVYLNGTKNQNPITSLTIYKCRKNINNFSLNSVERKTWSDANYPTLDDVTYCDEKASFEYKFSTPFTEILDRDENKKNVISISEYEGFIYLIQKAETAKQVRIIKIDYKNNTFTDRTITIPSSIKDFSGRYYEGNLRIASDLFLITGNEVYFPCVDGNMYSLNLENEVSTLRYATAYEIKITTDIYSFKMKVPGNDFVLIQRSGSYGGFNIVSKERVLMNVPYDSWYEFSSGIINLVFTYADRTQCVHLGNGMYYNSYNRVLWLDTYYLATINNLATPVTKTSAQTMKITYTLTYE